MKKVFVLGYALLFSASLLLAETTATLVPPTLSTTPTVAKPAQTGLPNATSSTVDGITRNIDRRLTYFNRYMQSHELENIKKLISQDNPDFYMNFMKYVESSAVFSLSRDSTQKIIKTPVGEYVFSAFMSVGDLKTKVSITFVEEKSTQGSKWLIKDSNLHTLVPLVLPAGGGLASSALGAPRPVNPGTTPPQPLPTSTTPAMAEPTPPAQTPAVSPVSSSAVTPDTQNPVTPKTSTLSIAGIGITTLLIWGIVGGSILVGIILLFIIRKRARKMTPILTSIATGSPIMPLDTSIPPILPVSAAPISNVSVSAVETVSPPLSMPTPLPSPEQAPIDESFVPLVTEMATPISFAPVGSADTLPEMDSSEMSLNSLEQAKMSSDNEQIVASDSVPSPALQADMPPVTTSDTLLLGKTPSELKNSPHPIFASALEEKTPQT